MPRVLISGGTGLVGTTLTRHLTAKGYDVTILTRDREKRSSDPKVSYAYWDIKKQEIDGNAITNADHIIHLAGAGVMDKKWSDSYKKEIVESRTHSSSLLIKGLQENPNHVKTVISASAIGWYGADSKPLLRKEGFIEADPPATNFLGETCRVWEESIEPIAESGIRLVKLRLGIVLGNDGGAFTEFKKPVRFGIAAILGNGKQVISWIHIDDICRLFIYAIENESLSGRYNAVAPAPVSNKTLILDLASELKGTFFIPIHVPQFIIKIMMGGRSVEILKSATVSAEKILGTGFKFEYPTLDVALVELAK